MSKKKTVVFSKYFVPPLILCLLTTTILRAQCVSDTIKIDCGNALVNFERQRYDTGKIAIVHVHENETIALQAATWLMDSLRKGSVTTWRGQQQRFIDFSVGSNHFRFDPNRIYTEAGIRSTLGDSLTDTAFALVQAVADTFLQHFIAGKNLIIAVHNNTDKGGLSVKSYTKGSSYFGDAKAVYINPNLDTDDFFYTTEDKYFIYLKKRQYNVVLQNNEKVTDDGSLSVYCARNNICYINVEAQNEHLHQQQEMLSILWKMMLDEDQNNYNSQEVLEVD